MLWQYYSSVGVIDTHRTWGLVELLNLSQSNGEEGNTSLFWESNLDNPINNQSL
jgi:hypothetical protein